MNASRRMILQVMLFFALGIGVAAVQATELAFDLPLRNGQLPKDKQLIRVTEGDVVTLRWSVDRPVVLHLHGYDIEKRFEPGVVGEMKFTARLTGRFPVHAHVAGGKGDETTLLYVEVYPR
jgi:hypothetical protein